MSKVKLDHDQANIVKAFGLNEEEFDQFQKHLLQVIEKNHDKWKVQTQMIEAGINLFTDKKKQLAAAYMFGKISEQIELEQPDLEKSTEALEDHLQFLISISKDNSEYSTSEEKMAALKKAERKLIKKLLAAGVSPKYLEDHLIALDEDGFKKVAESKEVESDLLKDFLDVFGDIEGISIENMHSIDDLKDLDLDENLRDQIEAFLDNQENLPENVVRENLLEGDFKLTEECSLPIPHFVFKTKAVKFKSGVNELFENAVKSHEGVVVTYSKLEDAPDGDVFAENIKITNTQNDRKTHIASVFNMEVGE